MGPLLGYLGFLRLFGEGAGGRWRRGQLVIKTNPGPQLTPGTWNIKTNMMGLVGIKDEADRLPAVTVEVALSVKVGSEEKDGERGALITG